MAFEFDIVTVIRGYHVFQRIWTPFVERSLSLILTIVSLFFFGRLGGAVKRTGKLVPLATWENNDPSLALPPVHKCTRCHKTISINASGLSILASLNTNNYFFNDA